MTRGPARDSPFDRRTERVHTNDRAARSAAELDAVAYTAGNHVVFARGRYQPATDEGRRLLAHELTHVAQQAGTPTATPESANPRITRASARPIASPRP